MRSLYRCGGHLLFFLSMETRARKRKREEEQRSLGERVEQEGSDEEERRQGGSDEEGEFAVRLFAPERHCGQVVFRRRVGATFMPGWRFFTLAYKGEFRGCESANGWEGEFKGVVPEGSRWFGRIGPNVERGGEGQVNVLVDFGEVLGERRYDVGSGGRVGGLQVYGVAPIVGCVGRLQRWKPVIDQERDVSMAVVAVQERIEREGVGYAALGSRVMMRRR